MLLVNDGRVLGRRGGAGMTLIEVILAVAILAIVAPAVCVMTMGAMNADRYTQASNASQSEVELAMRRIANNIKESQTLTISGNTLATVTQPDSVHGYANGANVLYSVAADPLNANQNVLLEYDQRYGTNTLVHNVTNFAVTPVSGAADLYQVDLVAGSQFVAERHFKVFARN